MYCLKCGVQNPNDSEFCSICDSQSGTWVAVISEKTSTNYAGFWRRFAAAMIDSIIIGIGGFIIGVISGIVIGAFLGGMGIDTPTIMQTVGGYTNVLGIVLNWLYFTLFESSSKLATLGKMALGIAVTDLSGNRILFGRANGSYWGKIVSAIILLIGFIIAGFTQKKQALHDIMASTLVVKK